MIEDIKYYAPCHIVNKIEQNVCGLKCKEMWQTKYFTLT